MSARIDYWGIGLLALGVGALQIGLDQGQQEDWLTSRWIASLLAAALVAIPVLIVHELRARAPVVELRVFKERSYCTGVILITVLGFVLYGSLVLLPILLQTMMGYPTVEAGIAMAPRGLGSLLVLPLVGLMMARANARRLVAGGLLIGALSLLWLARINLQAGYWDIFWPQFVQGVGLSLLFVPIATVAMDRVPKEKMGNAISLFNLMRNIGGSSGIALVQTFLARQRQTHTNNLVAHLNPYDLDFQMALQRTKSMFLAGGADPVTATKRSYVALYGMTQQPAGILSFNNASLLLGLVMVLVTPLVLLMRRPSRKGSPQSTDS